jgi:putative Ca2+/H+ antiporter (TMEM165/GDT1 family)
MDLLPFISTFGIIALAELGDKTQLLTMAFATRYRAKDVLASVLAASAVLMVLAVLAGRVLFELIPTTYVQIIAGVLFIIFAFWILFFDEEEEEENRENSGKAPFLTVFGAFMLAETGDKTQIATFALAAVNYNALFEVWAGATLGMFAANSIGIITGNRIREKFPEELIKKVAALLFFVFGAATLYAAL